jgi:pimeloyl-ACP methyl ester carboxylesterase
LKTAAELMLVHGAGCDHRIWKSLGAWPAEHDHRVVAVDLPGHGESGDINRQSISEHAIWLASHVMENNSGATVLIGHSMGGLVALEAASLIPGGLAGLVLMGVCCPMRVDPRLLARSHDEPIAAVDRILRWGIAEQGIHDNEQGADIVSDLRGIMTMRAAEVLYEDLAACAGYDGGLAAAARVSCATLVVHGAAEVARGN